MDTSIFYQIILPLLVTAAFNIVLFYLQWRKDRPSQAAHINGLRASTIQTMQETIDSLTQENRKLREEIDDLTRKLDENTMLLAAEIEKRKALEKVWKA